jgi:hypothetical protein
LKRATYTKQQHRHVKSFKKLKNNCGKYPIAILESGQHHVQVKNQNSETKLFTGLA